MKKVLSLLFISLLLSFGVAAKTSKIVMTGNRDSSATPPMIIISDTQYSFTSEVTLGYSTITMYDKSGNELYSIPAYIAAGTSIFTIPSGIAQQIDYVVVEYNDDILCGKAE